MKPKGYNAVYRSVLENWVWDLGPDEQRDQGAAWIEMILKAAHRDTAVTFMGHRIELRPGQLACTRRLLCKRWNWPTGKLHRYLERLKSEEMITIQGIGQGRKAATIITLLNYEKLQNSLGHLLGHSLGHSLGRTQASDSNDLQQGVGHSLGHSLGRSLGQEQEPSKNKNQERTRTPAQKTGAGGVCVWEDSGNGTKTSEGTPRSYPTLDKLPLTGSGAKEYPAEFQAFWDHWPARDGSRGDKAGAYTAWRRLTRADWLDRLPIALENYLASERVARGYPQDLTTWLRRDRWRGWIDVEAKPQAKDASDLF